MKGQVTIRGVSAELAQRLKSLAATRDESVNTLVLRLLADAVGLNERKERLARYATWTSDDLREFDDALRAQRQIDEDLWR